MKLSFSPQGKSFEVPAGDLGFSVTVFTLCALVTFALLFMRRYIGFFGGELGGNKCPKLATGIVMIFIWILYVILSALQSYGHIAGF